MIVIKLITFFCYKFYKNDLKKKLFIIRMSDFKFQKVFSIHFPGRKVYVECTFKKLHEKMEEIKKDKDHRLFYILKKYTNPEIRFEGYRYLSSQKEVVLRYYKDWYEILN